MNFLCATLELVLLVSLTHSRAILPDPTGTKLFNILEEDLLSDNVTLYQLNQLFYPPDNIATVTASINIKATTGNFSCFPTVWCGKVTHYWNETYRYCQFEGFFQWTSPAVNKRSQLQQHLFSAPVCNVYIYIDNAAFRFLSSFVQDNCYTITGNIDSRSANLSLHVENISYKGFCTSLATLVSWVSCIANSCGYSNMYTSV